MKHYNGIESGPVLRSLRKDRNLTIDKVCELSGISASTINQLEQGGRNLSMRTLYILMEIYEVDANTILSLKPAKGSVSIDERLSKMSPKQRDYFTNSFLFMLEQAESIS